MDGTRRSYSTATADSMAAQYGGPSRRCKLTAAQPIAMASLLVSLQAIAVDRRNDGRDSAFPGKGRRATTIRHLTLLKPFDNQPGV